MEVVEKTAKGKNIAVKKDTKLTTAASSTISTPTAAVAKPKTTNIAEANVETTTTTKTTKVVEVDAANSKSTAAITATTPTKATLLARNNMDKIHSLNDPSMILETISISDGEDSPPPLPTPAEVAAKKRKSVGSKAEEEERFRLITHRKIKVAGAPKMPLTGYVRYMNDRREVLKKEQPSKTAIELTKLIAEEWNQLTEERKAPYMKSAEADRQRYLSELQVFLKARPDVLACELAKNKPRKSTGNVAEPAAASSKSVFKDKQQTNGNASYKDTKETTSSKQVTKDDLAITASNTKARAIMHTRRLSVNYTMPTYMSKDRSPPAAAVIDKIKPKPAAAVAATTAIAAASPTNVAPPAKRKRTPTPTSNNSNNNNNNNNNYNNLAAALCAPVPGEIPIFTNEFLEHNKTFDMELRTLRKSKADLEQQNAVLEKHVENMKFGVEKMANENDELQEKNRLLEIYLDKLKRKLANALSGLSIPSEPQGATVENIDKYMSDLYKMSTSNTHGPASLNKAKDIIRKLDLQIQL